MLRISILTFLGSATVAMAHPGHETPVPDGAAHWLVSPDHLFVIGTATALVWLILGARVLRALKRE